MTVRITGLFFNYVLFTHNLSQLNEDPCGMFRQSRNLSFDETLDWVCDNINPFVSPFYQPFF